MAADIDYSNIKVLIIDDQPFIVTVVTTLLRQLGFHAISKAEDGGSGLKMVRAEKPDVILCDIEMEPIDGLGFLQTLRAEADSAYTSVPVIFLTSHADSETVGKARDLGVNAFIVKPPTAKALKDRIDFVLSRK